MEKLRKVLALLYKFIFDRFIGAILPFLNEKNKFSLIYSSGYWRGDSRDSKSGSGSSFDATLNIRRELPLFILKNNVKSMLDIPCGDFFWMSTLNLQLEKYNGADIVSSLIKENKKKFKKNNIQFFTMDLSKDLISEYDFIMVRDCFVHLTDKTILMSINNIINSNSKFLGTTNFPKIKSNSHADNNPDRWRPLNFRLPPFNFPKPIAILNDSWSKNMYDMDKELAIWEINDLKKYSD